MRRGDVVGVPISGGWVEDMSEKSGVRWSLVGVCSIGEREIDNLGFDMCFGVVWCDVGGGFWLCGSVVDVTLSWDCQNSSP